MVHSAHCSGLRILQAVTIWFVGGDPKEDLAGITSTNRCFLHCIAWWAAFVQAYSISCL